MCNVAAKIQSFCRKTSGKSRNLKFFIKKVAKKLGNSKKSSTFATAKQKLQRRERFKGESAAQQIGVWCNGNTADSGPAFPGSSPGTPT